MLNSDEEQRRRITMKSSSIALLHYDAPFRGIKKNMIAGKEPTKDRAAYLVNLIDSPGHVDFSADVSTALRVCDGAIIVIDAVEGVCPQTEAVMRQAFAEGIKPCVVMNKIDRLFTELQMSPLEAYRRLHRVIEDVNVVASELITSARMAAGDDDESPEEAPSQEESKHKEQESKTASLSEMATTKLEVDVSAWKLDDSTDKKARFSPRRGNVVFASARVNIGFN